MTPLPNALKQYSLNVDFEVGTAITNPFIIIYNRKGL
jgi:hypothetical protein